SLFENVFNLGIASSMLPADYDKAGLGVEVARIESGTDGDPLFCQPMPCRTIGIFLIGAGNAHPPVGDRHHHAGHRPAAASDKVDMIGQWHHFSAHDSLGLEAKPVDWMKGADGRRQSSDAGEWVAAVKQMPVLLPAA